MTRPDSSAPQMARGHVAQDTPFALIIAVGCVAAFALSWPLMVKVWTDGLYVDTDDAMRMVQVRDWLAGQGWYDLRALRLDPPAGTLMHWSRVVDLPLAALIRLFGLFTDPESADRLTRLAFPLAMQALLVLATGRLGRLLAGTAGAITAVALAVVSGFEFVQFVPGRIDHHAPQIVLLVFFVEACLKGLDPARPRWAALSGLGAALCLAIAIENLPFIFILGCVFPVAWMARGAPLRAALAWFATGLAGGLVICFGLFQSPAQWFVPVCDALSIVYLEVALAGGAAMLALAVLDLRLAPALPARAFATLVAGLITAVPLIVHRQCVLDPFTGLDPLVREVWLANVTEARSIATHLALYPDAWGGLIMPWALGTAALLVAALTTPGGLARDRWIALAAFCLAGSATAVFMIRSTANVTPLALMGGVFVCDRLHRALARQGRITRVAACILAMAPFATFAWMLVIPAQDNPQEARRQSGSLTCREPAGFAPLAALPKGLIFAPIDSGAHLLVHTPHAVLGGPYHRNNHGNRLVLDAFLATPDVARDLVRGSGARYLVFCPSQNQVMTMANRAPEGLAALLLKGETPNWLRPLALRDTPFLVFDVQGSTPAN